MSISIDANQIGYAVTAIVSAAATAIATTRKLARPLLQMAQQWREFREDWQGVPDRPGFRGHPGMPERMATTEAELIAIRSELQTNGGSTLKDAIKRIEAQQMVSAVHAGAPVLVGPTHAASGGIVSSSAAASMERGEATG